MKVNIATFNIQFGTGQDGRYDLDRIAEAIAEHDVVALQEVTTGWRACKREDQTKLLAARLNRYAVYAPAYEVDASYIGDDGVIVNLRRGFGNMILSRWPIVYSRPHSLPRPPTGVSADFHPHVDLPRVALEVTIDLGGTALRLMSVHLSHLPGPQRRAQIDVLRSLIWTLPGEPPLWELSSQTAFWSEHRQAPAIPVSTLLLGDFNFEPGDGDYLHMLRDDATAPIGLVDGWQVSQRRETDARTCVESDGRLIRLDYLFATADLRDSILSASVDQNCLASDHYPLSFCLDL